MEKTINACQLKEEYGFFNRYHNFSGKSGSLLLDNWQIGSILVTPKPHSSHSYPSGKIFCSFFSCNLSRCCFGNIHCWPKTDNSLSCQRNRIYKISCSFRTCTFCVESLSNSQRMPKLSNFGVSPCRLQVLLLW